ncbi:hypothetical protein TOPH_07451 [Tolypocladium ophioglossoides CBS 100239]|uniref:Uncharacterized protein n=1 Tax=Tolypocladium ophioglossoides (strain CBS 100239) TaxID=1163406 RepID=A0A0L0N1D6_TOLOC|nr:hypothetical protein TOPH_07451 [Tolypocladium ophioglossoides CBS 100239]
MTSFGAGASKDPVDGTPKYDELKRAPDNCSPSKSGYVDVKSYVDAAPAGATFKITCKAYKDFGYCDQLDAAKKFLGEMVNRGYLEGTFTVYNRKTALVHMYCSVAARPFFFNHHECPFEIPGDQDGDRCVNCPLRT